uniref:Uncharacterized protein n=1 Tax=Podarcis muralis TaxID=64176 RepID=A0A670HQB2_PODMU
MADEVDQQQTINTVKEPLDLIRCSLHTYDQHMIFSDVEETMTTFIMTCALYSTRKQVPSNSRGIAASVSV